MLQLRKGGQLLALNLLILANAKRLLHGLGLHLVHLLFLEHLLLLLLVPLLLLLGAETIEQLQRDVTARV